MKLKRHKALAISSLIGLISIGLIGCDDNLPIGAPSIGKPPAWAVVDCGQLRQLANSRLGRAELMRVLGEDALAFKTCRARHRALVRYISHRDSLLSGRPAPRLSLKD